MSYKPAVYATMVLAVFLMCSATARELPNENLQPLASGGSSLTWTQDGPGRWRLIGSLVDSNNRLACGLALASGKCMFTCGPGSPLCEGGTHTLPYGAFDLRGLPTEPDGTIMLQTFVFGNLPGRQVLDPRGGGGGGGTGAARWTATIGDICCPGAPMTYSVTVDGRTLTSTKADCGRTPSSPGWAITTAGSKSYSAVASSSCGDLSARGTITFAQNACYVFAVELRGQDVVTVIATVNCPSSADASILTEWDQHATPMAIYPHYPDGEIGLESYKSDRDSSE